ncbi:MAG: hypothetical protein KAJ12_13205, partial [Bacteroidetes bacterium]|nr:hypothetical protein [Bacteroidota bacterium]
MWPHAIIPTVLAVLTLANPAWAQEASSAGPRSSVDLTVYNQNLSLIREEREINLTRGTGRIVLPDIPATIDGTSLHFLSLTAPSAVRVLEQSYQYDLVHQAKLLERYLGKEIEFIRVDPETDSEYTVSGKLLSTGYVLQSYRSGGLPVYGSIGGMIVEVGG